MFIIQCEEKCNCTNVIIPCEVQTQFCEHSGVVSEKALIFKSSSSPFTSSGVMWRLPCVRTNDAPTDMGCLWSPKRTKGKEEVKMFGEERDGGRVMGKK